ncbi:MAG: RdgB/HAM1 family non-canonical purine NTP pyrophosphatase [Clostridia bacterium]|nr:RdgB/HAM1 family non-canonical purine NTP pyrophosphatase [Clostridia bacterium]
MPEKILLVATGNAGKLAEIKSILADFRVIGAKEAGIDFDAEETGTTFKENAAIKARELKKLTEHAVLADDSGLCVDALGGAPGVYSARYAGDNATDDENVDKLLSALQDVPEESRGAQFQSVVCLITAEGEELYGVGSCSGQILFERAGSGGFGYDPVFFSEDFGKSFGVLTHEQKNQISHRKRALSDLLTKL